MIYGRRLFDATQSFRKRRFRLVSRTFQLRYTFYFFGLSIISVVLFCGPILYFHNQNYHIFIQMAYDTNATLLDHLEREQSWINSFIAITAFGLLSASLFIGFHMTTRLIGPLMVLERHMRELTKGQWGIPEIRTRTHDEFRELIASYNYFYKSLKINVEAEIRSLEKMVPDPNNREAYLAWEALLDTKRQQIGIKDINESAAWPPSPRGSLHVS
jgi:hypothetical protein